MKSISTIFPVLLITVLLSLFSSSCSKDGWNTGSSSSDLLLLNLILMDGYIVADADPVAINLKENKTVTTDSNDPNYSDLRDGHYEINQSQLIITNNSGQKRVFHIDIKANKYLLTEIKAVGLKLYK